MLALEILCKNYLCNSNGLFIASAFPVSYYYGTPGKRLVSHAAACDGLVYSVNFNGQNLGTQGHALPLFED